MYRIVHDETNEPDGRRRRVVRLIFNGGSTESDEKEALLSLARIALNDDLDLKAVLIFAFSTELAYEHQSFDKGRVIATRDGRGWTGDGILLPGPAKIKDRPGFLSYQLNVNFIPEYIAL